MLGVGSIANLLPLGLVAVGGSAILISGLRGRREGNEPHCKRCSYNLTGLTSGRCPECGSVASVNSVVHGAYRPRWRVVLGSLLPLLLCAWMFGAVAYQYIRMISPRRHYPPGWLVNRLQEGDRLSFYELIRRDREGKLSDSGRNRFIEVAFSAQTTGSTPINRNRWFGLLDRWNKEGVFTQEQRRRFYRLVEKYVQPKFQPVPLSVRSGDRLQLPLSHKYSRFCDLLLVDAEVSIGGETFPVCLPDWLSGRPWWVSVRSNSSHGSFVPRIPLEPGNYTFQYRGQYELYAPGEYSHQGGSKPVLCFEKTVTADLKVLPAFDPSRILFLIDLELDEQVRYAMELELIYVSHAGNPQGRDSVSLVFVGQVSLPVDVAVEVILRTADGDIRLGTVLCEKYFCMERRLSFESETPVNATEAMVILRDDPQVARESMWVSEIWGGEIALGPVRVVHY
ncbi:MAG: hypothetical protein KAV82_08070 [Phycisphaerae bacterium]|nr:hypothetical protein [Phycisphaerae bacterium]